MKTIRTFIAITFTLGFLLACGGGGSSSGGTSYNVTGGWAGIYREELSGGSIFCQFNINGNLVQVGTNVSGTFVLSLASKSSGATCVEGNWDINGTLSGNKITVTQDGTSAIFTINNNNNISGSFNFMEDGVSGSARVNIGRQSS